MNKPKRYRPNSGWLNVKLPPKTDIRLREIAEKTGLKMTTIVVQGIESEYKEWKLAGFKILGETVVEKASE